ncbi:MAG: transposase [Rhodobacteraceae bacterium]|nr:transposase [Paracoccaceae bacterium]
MIVSPSHGSHANQCRAMDELLNEPMFRNHARARIVTRDWARDYNTNRPHSALGYKNPRKPAPNGVSTPKALVQAG